MSWDKQIYHYRFGDTVFAVKTPSPLRIRPIYESFRVSDSEEADYTVEVIPLESTSEIGRTLPPIVRREGNRIIMEANGEDIPNVTVGNILTMSNAAFAFLERDAFILHASYILYRGRAILFCAPSGAGKSTQANYWAEYRGAEVINGDRSLIERRDGAFRVSGVYVSGKSGISKNVTAPIEQIVLLEKGNVNERTPLLARETFVRLLNQSTYDISSVQQCEDITALVAELIEQVPVICYRCRNHPDAIDDLERLIWKEKHD